MAEANLEQRVAALEGADRDVAEFRAVQRGHTELLNAMREDLTEFRGEVRAGFAAQAQGMERIVQLLTERGSGTSE